jgi:hypothetical protein
MLACIAIGEFLPIQCLMIALCGTLLFSYLGIRERTQDKKFHKPLLIIAFFLLLIPRLNPFLYNQADQDEGIYVNMASFFAMNGSLHIQDKVRQNLNKSERILYDQNNHYTLKSNIPNQKYNTYPDKYEGVHSDAVYIKNLDSSIYTFQFYPLHPLWMSLFKIMFGKAYMIYSLTIFSILSILGLGMLAYEIAGKKQSAFFIAVGLLAINPMHVFLSRFPVTENVSLFFSSFGFLYLIKWFKSTAYAPNKTYLIISIGCFWCLFFNHIAGFLYGPIFLAMILSLVTATPRKNWPSIATWGLMILIGYVLSFWYGLYFSFPYSYAIYSMILFGGIAKLIANHPGLIGLGLFVIYGFFWIGIYLTTRNYSSNFSKKISRGSLLNYLIMLFFIALIVLGILKGLNLIFNDVHFNPEHLQLLKTFTPISSKWDTLSHASLFTLCVYVSVPGMLFFIAYTLIKFKKLDGLILLLIFSISFFMLIRVIEEEITIYYYYGRYLCGELLPYIIVTLSVYFSQLLSTNSKLNKIISYIILSSMLGSSIFLLSLQYNSGERYRLDSTFSPIIETITAKDLIIFDEKNYAKLFRGMVDNFYGLNTLVASDSLDSLNLVSSIIKSNKYQKIYFLSPSPLSSKIGELTLLKNSHVYIDTYDKKFYNIIPQGSSKMVTPVYLYQLKQ